MTEETQVWVVVEHEWEREDLSAGDLSSLDAYTSLEGAERAAGNRRGDAEVYQVINRTKLVSVVRTIKTTEVERF